MKLLNFPCFTLYIILMTMVIPGCKQKKTELKSPPNYNFQEGVKTNLELKIKEISGLAWETVNDKFICHNDESGRIFMLDKETKKIVQEIKFGSKGDYEDIAAVNGTPYILRSDGLITKVTTSGADSVNGEELGKPEIEGDVDFETMYYDSTRNALIIICKNCKVDNKATVSAFAYYLDSAAFVNTPVYKIDAAKIEEMSPKETSKFQPSAASINPRLQKLFIISSASNLLVVADLDGKVESVHWLAPKMFPQPEGITFKRATGDMFISNEGVTGQSTILRFLFKPKL